MWKSLKNTLLNLHTSSFHLTPALKTRSSVYLRITLKFVKNAHSVGVGLSSRTACSPAGYGFLWRWSVSYALRNYFNIEVGNWGKKNNSWVVPQCLQDEVQMPLHYLDIIWLLTCRVSNHTSFHLPQPQQTPFSFLNALCCIFFLKYLFMPTFC